MTSRTKPGGGQKRRLIPLPSEESATTTDLHSWLRGLAKQIRGGESLNVTTAKHRTLTATRAEYLEREPYRCNGWRIYMEGYGTEYELEVPDGSKRPPTLLYPSSSATGEVVKDVDVEDDGPKIVAEQTAADLGIPSR